MTPAETVQVLRYLSTGWPYIEIDEARHVLWIDQLSDLDAADVGDAAKRIVRDDDRFPTVARVREVTRAIARSRPQPAALPMPRTDTDVAKAHIADARAALERGRGREPR